jgi:hypothetical protein
MSKGIEKQEVSSTGSPAVQPKGKPLTAIRDHAKDGEIFCKTLSKHKIV